MSLDKETREDDVPQFFDQSKLPVRTDWAIYSVPGSEGELTIAVECVEGAGNAPRNASSLSKISKLDLDKEMKSVAAVADHVLRTLSELHPGDLEIEFGVELGGKLGFPMITQGEAKANFKVTLKWAEGNGGRK